MAVAADGFTYACVSTGAGGSSYISGYAGCIAIKSETDITPKVDTYTQISDSYHYSNIIFGNTGMEAGKNTGSGKAIITYYSVKTNV